jgi:ribonuclease HII
MSSKTFPSLQTESAIFDRGNRFVIGVDEVGRGAIAGPVAVGVTLLDRLESNLHSWPEKLQDSKLMTAKSRAAIASELRQYIPNHAVGYSSNQEIDELGITQALRLAARRALTELFNQSQRKSELSTQGAVILLDGSQNWLAGESSGLEVNIQVKADASCVSVAAAAVLAKLARDSLMELEDANYPQYGFAGHKGYASAKHIEALRSVGPCPIHRVSWLSRILS